MLRESLNRAILGCWEDKLEEQSYSENTAPHKSLSNTKLIVTSKEPFTCGVIHKVAYVILLVTSF